MFGLVCLAAGAIIIPVSISSLGFGILTFVGIGAVVLGVIGIIAGIIVFSLTIPLCGWLISCCNVPDDAGQQGDIELGLVGFKGKYKTEKNIFKLAGQEFENIRRKLGEIISPESRIIDLMESEIREKNSIFECLEPKVEVQEYKNTDIRLIQVDPKTGQIIISRAFLRLLADMDENTTYINNIIRAIISQEWHIMRYIRTKGRVDLGIEVDQGDKETDEQYERRIIEQAEEYGIRQAEQGLTDNEIMAVRALRGLVIRGSLNSIAEYNIRMQSINALIKKDVQGEYREKEKQSLTKQFLNVDEYKYHMNVKENKGEAGDEVILPVSGDVRELLVKFKLMSKDYTLTARNINIVLVGELSEQDMRILNQFIKENKEIMRARGVTIVWMPGLRTHTQIMSREIDMELVNELAEQERVMRSAGITRGSEIVLDIGNIGELGLENLKKIKSKITSGAEGIGETKQYLQEILSGLQRVLIRYIQRQGKDKIKDISEFMNRIIYMDAQELAQELEELGIKPEEIVHVFGITYIEAARIIQQAAQIYYGEHGILRTSKQERAESIDQIDRQDIIERLKYLIMQRYGEIDDVELEEYAYQRKYYANGLELVMLKGAEKGIQTDTEKIADTAEYMEFKGYAKNEMLVLDMEDNTRINTQRALVSLAQVLGTISEDTVLEKLNFNDHMKKKDEENLQNEYTYRKEKLLKKIAYAA